MLAGGRIADVKKRKQLWDVIGWDGRGECVHIIFLLLLYIPKSFFLLYSILYLFFISFFYFVGRFSSLLNATVSERNYELYYYSRDRAT